MSKWYESLARKTKNTGIDSAGAAIGGTIGGVGGFMIGGPMGAYLGATSGASLGAKVQGGIATDRAESRYKDRLEVATKKANQEGRRREAMSILGAKGVGRNIETPTYNSPNLTVTNTIGGLGELGFLLGSKYDADKLFGNKPDYNDATDYTNKFESSRINPRTNFDMINYLGK